MNYQINKNILRATSYSCVVYTLLKGTQLWVWGDVWGLKFRRPFLWRVMGFSLFLFFYFIFLLLYNCFMSFPSGWTVKNLPANKGDAGSVFGLRRSPGEGNGKPLQYSCLGSPMDRGAWRAIVHGVAELDRIYKFVLFSAAQQGQSAICIQISPLFLDFLHIYVTTEHWVEFPVLYSRFSLFICFIHSINSVCVCVCVYIYICMCQSQTPNSSHPSFPLSIHIFVLFVYVSTSALQIRSSIPFF